MIYGINFGAPQIPPAIKKKFAERHRSACQACVGTGLYKGDTESGHGCLECSGQGKVWFYLKGVAQSVAERQQMLIQATNGTRQLHVVERQTAAGPWFGIYTY